ncbi:MAG: hypothetical protein ACI4KR_01640 [Ruminiclostridium sp.]
MEIFTVSLFGHRRLENPFAAEQRLEKIVDSLLHSDKYVEFIVGREGDFDILAASVIRRRQKALDYGMSALVLVLPYQKAEYSNNPSAFEQYYDEVRICEEASKAHFKAAYKIRNRIVAEQFDLRQYRIIIVVRPRSQIFRQIVQKFRRHTNVCQEISVQDDGKDASKRAAKAPAVNCAVLP